MSVREHRNEIIRNHAAFVWSVADLLRGDFKQSECGRVSCLWWSSAAWTAS